MANLGDVVEKAINKNAGPFWLTIDIFCGSSSAFEQTSTELSTERVANIFWRGFG